MYLYIHIYIYICVCIYLHIWWHTYIYMVATRPRIVNGAIIVFSTFGSVVIGNPAWCWGHWRLDLNRESCVAWEALATRLESEILCGVGGISDLT